MDAKARIGLAIGGIVLAGMVAYVLMPAKTDSDVAQAPPADTPVAPPAATAPTTEPTDPFAAFPTTTTAPSDPMVDIGGPGTLPTATRDPWGVLDTGAGGPTMSRDTTSSFGRDSGSAFGTDSVGRTTSTFGRDSGEPLNTMPSTYKIQQGDSLYTISQKLFGSPRYVSQIQKANPGLNPSRLRVGQEIKLPRIETASGSASGTTAMRSGADASARESASAVTTGKTYKVQPGDSLHKIAQKVYGRRDMWEKIYALNRSQIGNDPQRIKVGMTLQLPEQ